MIRFFRLLWDRLFVGPWVADDPAESRLAELPHYTDPAEAEGLYLPREEF